MLVSIDGAGRIVIPKDFRELLGLHSGAELDIEVLGDGLHITPRRPAGRRVVEVDGWPVIEAGPQVTTDADVQAWRHAGQR